MKEYVSKDQVFEILKDLRESGILSFNEHTLLDDIESALIDLPVFTDKVETDVATVPVKDVKKLCSKLWRKGVESNSDIENATYTNCIAMILLELLHTDTPS